MSPGKNGFSARSSSATWLAVVSIDGNWVLTVLLEVGGGSSHELDSSKLESMLMLTIIPNWNLSVNLPTSLETSDDRTNESTLNILLVHIVEHISSLSCLLGRHQA